MTQEASPSEPDYILLRDWAARKFKPVPSAHTLRALARTDRIEPPAHKVGRDYYVAPDARLAEPKSELVKRMQKGRR